MLSKDDLKQIRKVVNEEIKDETKTLKEDVSRIRGDIKVIVSYFDREYVDLRKRVENIEDHLGLRSKN